MGLSKFKKKKSGFAKLKYRTIQFYYRAKANYRRIDNNIKIRLLLLFIFSIIISLVFYFVKLNDNSLVSNHIRFLNSKNSKLLILNVKVYSDDNFKSNGDILIIEGKITKIDPSILNENIIIVSINKDLKLVESNFKVTNKYKEFENINYCLDFSSQRDIIYLRFVGDIFNRTNQEINNSFYCDIDNGGYDDTTLYPQTSFSFTGLYNYYNLNTFPEKEMEISKNIISINYPAPTFDKKNTIFNNDGIWISAEHKQRKYSNQIKSYLITTVIGILISAFIELLIYQVKKKN